MVKILTASGWSSPADHIYSQVKRMFEGDERIGEVIALHWQIESSFQKIEDFIDSREAKEVILDLSNQILRECKAHEPLLIISFSTGSLLVEEALTLVIKSHSIPPIRHLLLAPAINGSNWANVGSIAKVGVALLVGRGVMSDRVHILWKMLLGVAGVTLVKSLFSDETILDSLRKKFEDLVLHPARIPRFILMGKKDVVVRDVPTNLSESTYYLGDYTHSEVGSLEEEDLKQVYSETLPKVGENSAELSKLEIINRILFLYGSLVET